MNWSLLLSGNKVRWIRRQPSRRWGRVPDPPLSPRVSRPPTPVQGFFTVVCQFSVGLEWNVSWAVEETKTGPTPLAPSTRCLRQRWWGRRSTFFRGVRANDTLWLNLWGKGRDPVTSVYLVWSDLRGRVRCPKIGRDSIFSKDSTPVRMTVLLFDNESSYFVRIFGE